MASMFKRPSSPKIRLVRTQRQSQRQKQRRIIVAAFSLACLFGAILFVFQIGRKEVAYAANTNTWTNGHGNNLWNDATNWSRGTVPGATDIATFSGSVGDCSINANANVSGILIDASYTGNVTQATGKTLTVGASGFTQQSGTFTAAAVGMTINGGGTFNLSNGTFNAPTGTLNIGGANGSSTTLFTHSGGTFNANAGTVNINPSINSWAGSPTLTLDVIASTHFYNLTVNAATCCNTAIVATATGDTVLVDNNLTHTDGYISGIFSLAGNLTVGSGADGGTGTIVVNGSGAQTYASAGLYRTAGLYINKSAGTFSPATGTTNLSTQWFTLADGSFTAPSGTMSIGGAWGASMNLFTQLGGTFTANSGTISFDPAINSWVGSPTATIDVLPTTQFNNITFSASTCCNTAIIATASGDTLHATGNITHSDGYITGLAEFKGNLIVNSGADGGTGWLIADGTGAQIYTSAGSYRTCGLRINQTGTFAPAGGTSALSVQQFALDNGTFTAPSGTLSIGGPWGTNVNLYTQTGGAFNHNSGTVAFDPAINSWVGSPTGIIDVLSTTLFNNITVNASTCCNTNIIATATGDTLHAVGNMTHSDGYITGFIAFQGNLTVNSGADGGTGWLIAEGTNAQTYSVAGNYRTCGLMVNKSSNSFTPAVGSTALSVQKFELDNGTFTAPTGNFNIGGPWGTNMTLFNHVSGTFNANGSNTIFDPAINSWTGSPTGTIDVLPSTQFSSVTVNASTCCNTAIIATASGDTVHASGSMTHSDGYITGVFEFQGNLTVNNGADGGSGWLIADGTTAQTYSVTGNYRTCGLMINKSSNSFTPAVGSTALSVQKFELDNGSFTAPTGNFNIGGPWGTNMTLFNHTGGTYNANGGTTIFDPAINSWTGSPTGTIDVLPTTQFSNVTVSASTCCNTTTVATAAGDTVHASGSFTHSDGYITGLFEFQGNLTVNNGADGGSGWLIADGTNAQEYSVAGNYRTCGLLVNKSSNTFGPAVGSTALSVQKFELDNGTFTAPAGSFNIGGPWGTNMTLFNHTGGTFTANGGTVEFDPAINSWVGSPTATIDVISSTQFNNVTITASTCCNTVSIATATGDTLHATGTITHNDGYITGLFEFKSDLIITSNSDGGTGWWICDGTGNEVYTCSGNYRTCGLYVDKASGSLSPGSSTTNFSIQRLYLKNGIFIAPAGNLNIGGPWSANTTIYTQTNGVFTHNDGTVVFDPVVNSWVSSPAFTIDVQPSTQFKNINYNATSCCNTPTLVNAVTDTVEALGTVTYTDGKCNSLTEAYGNVTVTSGFDGGTGGLIFKGSSNQNFDLTGATNLFDATIRINKTAGKVYLQSPLIMDALLQSLTLVNGDIVSTATNILTLGDNVTTTGGSQSSFVDGPMSKKGNDAFTFPLGTRDSLYAPISISAPAGTTDQFTASYYFTDPDPLYPRSSKDASLVKISSMEYWSLSRDAGATNSRVTLSWRKNRSGGVSVPSELAVARWDGTTWRNNGNGGVTGTADAGTVVTLTNPTTFIVFTLGSSTGNNALPIELLSFDAVPENGKVNINWSTASEENNDYFTIERTPDSHTIEQIARQKGAGTTVQQQDYSAVDEHPLSGISYYRLKQTDFDGKFTYSDWKKVDFNQSGAGQLNLYPNPGDGKNINLHLPNGATQTIVVEYYNAAGHLIDRIDIPAEPDKLDYDIHPAQTLPPGTYLIQALVDGMPVPLKLLVR